MKAFVKKCVCNVLPNMKKMKKKMKKFVQWSDNKNVNTDAIKVQGAFFVTNEIRIDDKLKMIINVIY